MLLSEVKAMPENKMTTYVIIEDKNCAVKVRRPKEIQVIVRTPDKLHERVQQQKINRIYDILKPNTQH